MVATTTLAETTDSNLCYITAEQAVAAFTGQATIAPLS